MGNFRSDSRGGFGGRSGGRSSGRSSGGFGGRDRDFGGRDRSSGRRDFGGRPERKSFEMHDVTCDKCGKNCQVPFKPSGNKPVLCSDCFSKKEGGSRNNFDSRPSSGSGSSGMSSEQFNTLNKKLDKIITFLESIEEEEEFAEEEEEDEDAEEDEKKSE